MQTAKKLTFKTQDICLVPRPLTLVQSGVQDALGIKAPSHFPVLSAGEFFLLPLQDGGYYKTEMMLKRVEPGSGWIPDDSVSDYRIPVGVGVYFVGQDIQERFPLMAGESLCASGTMTECSERCYPMKGVS